MIYPDGSKYLGDFKMGQRHGHGEQSWRNGKVYIGAFKDGK